MRKCADALSEPNDDVAWKTDVGIKKKEKKRKEILQISKHEIIGSCGIVDKNDVFVRANFDDSLSDLLRAVRVLE